MLKVRVPEDTSPWKDILQVSAQDADANSKLVFSIHSRQDQDTSALFHLDPRSGVLVLKEELDYETAPVHTLTLMVGSRLLAGASVTAGPALISSFSSSTSTSSGARPGDPSEEELC